MVLAIIKRALQDPEHKITLAVEAEAANSWSAAEKYYNDYLLDADKSDFAPEYDFCLESYFKVIIKFLFNFF